MLCFSSQSPSFFFLVFFFDRFRGLLSCVRTKQPGQKPSSSVERTNSICSPFCLFLSLNRDYRVTLMFLMMMMTTRWQLMQPFCYRRATRSRLEARYPIDLLIFQVSTSFSNLFRLIESNLKSRPSLLSLNDSIRWLCGSWKVVISNSFKNMFYELYA